MCRSTVGEPSRWYSFYYTREKRRRLELGSTLLHEAFPCCVSTQLVQLTAGNHHLPRVLLPRGVSVCRDSPPLNSRRRGLWMARNPSLETVTGDHDSINARSQLQLSGARSNQWTTHPQCSRSEADNGRHAPGTRPHSLGDTGPGHAGWGAQAPGTQSEGHRPRARSLGGTGPGHAVWGAQALGTQSGGHRPRARGPPAARTLQQLRLSGPEAEPSS